ncbi:hypothetical protein [Shinella zoogloeoides]|uniref:Uncharacterized protein n=1 Tax=Shinella zoogloeoides TaxID=352475 RepID=A0A6N8TDX4_SHIZO|nr:hypothetical protein [Shinella zoogloeoides]MXN99417.1 hypothetical protein [Shinella zoogloeoides]UEX82804.1 hypothetical protein K8M09_05860 [Shinella zoogloeoides]
MFKWLKRAIAEWLCPEIFHEHRTMKIEFARLVDAYWWLGEFPEAAATLRWLLDNHQDWHGLVDLETRKKRAYHWRQDISSFREQLRRGEHLKVFGPAPSAIGGGE